MQPLKICLKEKIIDKVEKNELVYTRLICEIL